MGVGGKEFDDGLKVDVGLAVFHADDLRLAVGEELFGLGFGDECHLRGSFVSGPQRSVHPRRRTAQGPRGTRVTLIEKRTCHKEVATDEVH
jgi:hypothetical protein